MEEAAPDYYGSLVAFEGSPDVISTQLRLLPTSPQILALPSVQDFIEENHSHGDKPFDPRSFIRRVHEASAARRKLAVEFLKESSPTRKRLVFLNGGTISAHTLCVTAIRQHQGIDDVEAQAVFCGLVKGGLAGLVVNERTSSTSSCASSGVRPGAGRAKDEEEAETQDPITKAMRAADALDRETESLQEDTILDLEMKARPRSTSLPVYAYPDPTADAFTLFFRSGLPQYTGGSVSTVASSSSPEDPDAAQGLWFRATIWDSSVDAPSRRPSRSGEKLQPSSLPKLPSDGPGSSPTSEVFDNKTPLSPGNVVFEKAEVIDMGPLNVKTPLRKVRSLDRIFRHERAGGRRLGSLDSRIPLPVRDAKTDAKAKAATDSPNPDDKDSRRHSWLGVPGGIKSSQRQRPSHLDLRRAVVCKANQTTIQRSTSRRIAGRGRVRYVDKGTDAADMPSKSPSWTGESRTGASTFGPVLPLMEDLIIHFTGDTHHALFESIMQGFKNGDYPVSTFAQSQCPSSTSDRSSLGCNLTDFPTTPTTPVSPLSVQHKSPSQQERHRSPSPPQADDDDDEYDPFRPQSTNPQQSGIPGGSNGKLQYRRIASPPRLVTALEPPTPAQTPEPHASSQDTGGSKFYDFSITGKKSAVGIQSALRAVLNGYFPSEDQGYQHNHFPLLMDMGELWRPVFGEGVSGEHNGSSGKKMKLDLILAVGAEKAVKREFLSAVTAQVEKLGTKPSKGFISRTGRLDLRYLIANAMHTFASRPHASRTQESPSTNPALLATLIIPHLDVYLAAHSGVRFLLLDYPDDHLATVLALQKLIGTDACKVAGLVSGSSSNSNSNNNAGGGRSSSIDSTTHHRAVKSISSSKSSSKSAEAPPSFTKADFLLTTTAADSEIATFISGIWKVLIDVSPFYVPEHLPSTIKHHNQHHLHHHHNHHGHAAATTTSSSSRTAAAGVAAGVHPPQKPLPPLVPGQFNSSHAGAAAVMMGIAGGLASPPLSPPDSALFTSSGRGGTGSSSQNQNPHHAQNPRSTSPAPSTRSRASVASGKTSRTARSVKARLRALNGLGGGSGGAGAESVFEDYDPAEDSDYDFEERRLMPLYMNRGRARKGNSRKALKWLGLA